MILAKRQRRSLTAKLRPLSLPFPCLQLLLRALLEATLLTALVEVSWLGELVKECSLETREEVADEMSCGSEVKDRCALDIGDLCVCVVTRRNLADGPPYHIGFIDDI